MTSPAPSLPGTTSYWLSRASELSKPPCVIEPTSLSASPMTLDDHIRFAIKQYDTTLAKTIPSDCYAITAAAKKLGEAISFAASLEIQKAQEPDNSLGHDPKSYSFYESVRQLRDDCMAHRVRIRFSKERGTDLGEELSDALPLLLSRLNNIHSSAQAHFAFDEKPFHLNVISRAVQRLSQDRDPEESQDSIIHGIRQGFEQLSQFYHRQEVAAVGEWSAVRKKHLDWYTGSGGSAPPYAG